ncbi:hypothetical protein [Vibrio mediterranei]|uniref:hypothetical protein n=1 Tax=Vibrio mediterranei TaxID=689 RepID=UPI004068A213
MIDHQEFFPKGFKPISVKVNTSSFTRNWKPKDYGVPVEIDRSIGSTGSFRYLYEKYGTELRKAREDLYGALDNLLLKVADNLWLSPNDETWEKAMVHIDEAKNRLYGIKAELRQVYPEKVNTYANEVEQKTRDLEGLRGIGELIRKKAPAWAYFEERLQVHVHLSYGDIAKHKVFSELEKRVATCLKNLKKDDEYRISKYTRSHIESACDWARNYSVYQPDLCPFVKAFEQLTEKLPERVSLRGDYKELSLSIAKSLNEVHEVIIELMNGNETKPSEPVEPITLEVVTEVTIEEESKPAEKPAQDEVFMSLFN